MRIIESVFHKQFRAYRDPVSPPRNVVGARIFFHPGNLFPTHYNACGGLEPDQSPIAGRLRHLRAHRPTLSQPCLKLFHIGITDGTTSSVSRSKASGHR